MLIQVTGALRNFAGDKVAYSDMLLGQVVERTLRTLELFFTHSELVYNACRVLSKLSIEEKCCRIMLDKDNLYASVSLLQRVLLTYSEHAAVVSRLSRLPRIYAACSLYVPVHSLENPLRCFAEVGEAAGECSAG